MKRIYDMLQPHCEESKQYDTYIKVRIGKHHSTVHREVRYKCEHEEATDRALWAYGPSGLAGGKKDL